MPATNDPERALAQFLADWCGLWMACDRAPCRRAFACRAAGAPCFAGSPQVAVEVLASSPLFRDLADRVIALIDDGGVL